MANLGTLPNGLSVDDIVAGTSMPRNNFLFANAIYLLPYTGAGSGIQRALSQSMKISFSNNEQLHEFVITILRNNLQTDVNLDTKRENSDIDLDTLYADSDTKKNNSDTDLDTNSDTDSDTSIRIKLNNKQKDIVNYCSVPRSSKEILERAGVSNHSKNREKYVTFLVNAGYLETGQPHQIFNNLLR